MTASETASDPVRVIIVDDALVRAGLAMILGGDDDIDVVGQAGDGQAGVALASRLRPHVVLMDIRSHCWTASPQRDG